MSENQAENESESSLPTFRPFTREELAVIENRITEKNLAAKKKAERRARNIAVKYTTLFRTKHWSMTSNNNGLMVFIFQEFGDSARARKLYEQDSDDDDDEEIEPNPKLEQGN